MAKPHATVTLRESEQGEVYVHVQTREPLGPYEILDRRWEPEQFLNQEPNRGSVELMCTLESTSGLWLPQFRAGTPFWMVDRYVDITAQSDERRLLERLVAQDDFEIVWANEGVRARRPVHERTREVLQETFGAFPDLDAPTWKEAVAESEWRSSTNWRPGPRPKPPERRTATPPEGAALRYFAPRTGALPREGAATVAGVRLPRGSRLGGFWCTDEPAGDTFELASRLASEFSATGLWPLLWPDPDEPTGYMSGDGELDTIDDVNAAELLEREWAALSHGQWSEPYGAHFPGHAAPVPRDPSPPFDPFQTVKRHFLGASESLEARLLMVPCNRPADALTALAFVGEGFRSEHLSAILRLWEERFGAVVAVVDPGYTFLGVEAPPQTFPHALLLAAEQFAVASQSDPDLHGSLAGYAKVLLGNPVWGVSWRR